MQFSPPTLHPPVIRTPEQFATARAQMAARSRPRAIAAAAAPAAADTITIPLTTVSLNSNFDAYIDLWFEGSESDKPTQLLVDSGNSILIVPRWEDIAALPNARTNYTVLGTAQEPWGCPANVVSGPIRLVSVTGVPHVIDKCEFLACTGDGPEGSRTANFGAGCLSPWSANGWASPQGLGVTLQAPLSYRADYPFAVFDYAAAATVQARAGITKVSTESSLILSRAQPAGFAMYDILPQLEWMSLSPLALVIDGNKTSWPGSVEAPIAVIDTGGGPVFLSDPNGYVYETAWSNPVDNPAWTSSSESCESVGGKISLTIGTTAQPFTYSIDPVYFPPLSQGLTLVMCKKNYYMMDEQGMNIGGVSALVNRILIDYGTARVGFQPK
jgi:hypothetical protein